MKRNIINLFTSIGVSLFFILFVNNISSSQTVDRYLFLHQNSKNDSQIKRSPLSSGYDRGRALEFIYEPIPGESMKKRAESIFGKQEGVKEYEDDEISNILGDYNFDFTYEEESTYLKELDNEAEQAILKQQTEIELANMEKLKNNVASYAAKVEAKKKRDKEAELERNNPSKASEKNGLHNPLYPSENSEGVDDSESYEFVFDKNGKLRIKKNISENASDTKDLNKISNPN